MVGQGKGRACLALSSIRVASPLQGSDCVLLLPSPQNLCEVCPGKCLINRTGQMQAEAELKGGPQARNDCASLGGSQCLGGGGSKGD